MLLWTTEIDSRNCSARIRRIGVRVLPWLLIVGIATSFAGCERPPQFSAANQRLLESLRTAISARKPDWVGANANRIAELHQQGKLSDEEVQVLQQVIDAARSGDWKSAEQRILLLEKGQRPSATKSAPI